MDQQVMIGLAAGAGAFIALGVSFLVGFFVGRSAATGYRPAPKPSMVPSDEQMAEMERVMQGRFGDFMRQQQGQNGGAPRAGDSGFMGGGM